MKIRKKLAAIAFAFALVTGGSVATAAPSQAADIPATYNTYTKVSYRYNDGTNFFWIKRPYSSTASRIAVTFYTSKGTSMGKMTIDNARVGRWYGVNVKDLGLNENVTYRFVLSEASGKKWFGWVNV